MTLMESRVKEVMLSTCFVKYKKVDKNLISLLDPSIPMPFMTMGTTLNGTLDGR